MPIVRIEDTVTAMPEATKGLWYLGSPYSHQSPAMRELRFRAVARVAGRLYRDHGVKTYCPIAHTHPVEVELMYIGEKAQGFDFWLPWDFEFFPHMRGLIVACLPGWEQSKGLNQEVPKMLGDGKPVAHLDLKQWFTPWEWQQLGGSADEYQ